ncbi:hypothetical protein POL68_28795 [Stigmatella sp. ncwal1]|uniref:Uncharacterized protein n=1 Tax=Stigmatella ashevillensis TaxID=2995309 RepID=A0ABT5DFP9_9BACT|nr:hypothetical protein [Stigmatella ashevillena]MDC0712495.1 hypothetical protein [Stigmatella ashevillena]
MKPFWKPLLLCLLLTTPAWATGPSSVDVRLYPLAARKGAVLLRTRWEANPSGAHAFIRTEYGWLVIDARGKWHDVPHVTLEPGTSAEKEPWEERQRLDKAFETPLDWKSPPESVAGLLRQYGFTQKDEVKPDQGRGSVSLTPKALCQGKRCSAPCVQRSLKGLKSDPQDGTQVEASFVHSGLALFHNHRRETAEEPTVGASFSESGTGTAWGVEGIEYEDIWGVCPLPR